MPDRRLYQQRVLNNSTMNGIDSHYLSNSSVTSKRFSTCSLNSHFTVKYSYQVSSTRKHVVCRPPIVIVRPLSSYQETAAEHSPARIKHAPTTGNILSASSTGFPRAKWGLGNSRAREKREGGMMGTSVEREREVMPAFLNN